MPSAPHVNLPYQSLPLMLRRIAEQHADRPALSYKRSGSYITLSYQQFYLRVLMTARGLRKAGMRPGDNVAIFSENRIGWAIADFGIQAAGGASVPIYATNTGAQAAHIINHCAAKIVFV
jgi:long-chain acyl-CoA synthetase